MSKSYSNPSSSDTNSNHFTPDTPDSESWQQYRCRSCNLPKRIPVAPSEAPMTDSLNCKRCESKQQHRADGGSACVAMLDLTENPDVSPAEVMGRLRGGQMVISPVVDDADNEYVRLWPGDETCSACNNPILIADFPESAPFIRLLANQKRKRDTTHCEACLSEVVVNE